MKKALSSILCYALGMVVVALDASAAVSSVVSSEDFSLTGLWGKTPAYAVETCVGEGKTFWNYDGAIGNLSVITNYEGVADAPYAAFGESFNVKPGYMKSGGDNTGLVKFLGLYPLMRSFLPLGKQEGSLIHHPVSIPADNDLFVDMLVEFEPRIDAATAVPAADVESGLAKFMCWLSCPPGAAETNFIVTAGYCAAGETLVRTNYVTTARVTPGWHRLTARAIANASLTRPGEAGFALYLDGEEVVCSAAAYDIGFSRAEMDDRFGGNEHYERGGLFLPLRPMNALRGVAVQGYGRFDELGVVTNGNPLAGAAGTSLSVAVLAEPSDVTNVCCEIYHDGDELPAFTTNSAGLARIDLTVLTNDTVVVRPFARSGVTPLPELATSGNLGACDWVDGYRVKLKSAFSDGGRLTLRVLTSLEPFEVDGVAYKTMEDALFAANASARRRLSLLSDVVLDPQTDNGQMQVLPGYRNLVFDLRGCKLKGQHFQDEATIYVQGSMTIVDSVGGGVIEAPGKGVEVDVSTNDALVVQHGKARLQLGSESDEYRNGDFTVSGRVSVVSGELDIRGGTYLSPSDLPEKASRFYLADYVDQARFRFSRLDDAGDRWRVLWSDYWTVRFEVAQGTATPAVTNVLKGTRIDRPVVDAPGYVTGDEWYDKATQLPWDFASDTVTNDLTLVVASQTLREYKIAYDPEQVGAPTNYTVSGRRQALPTLYRDRFAFLGWQDAQTGLFVTHVGANAVFVGTDIPVSGDLSLCARWQADELSWTNASGANSESNGTYGGSWALTLHPDDGIPAGSRMAIDEIDFCIVNPNLYPKTAEYLAVRPAGGAIVVSAPRTYPLDEVTGEYLVAATNRLANGRPRVAYRFTGLVLEVGAENEVFFCTGDGSPAKGFLRLKYNLYSGGTLFGNCQEPGGVLVPASEEYRKYCPVYEVHGHLKGDDE